MYHKARVKLVGKWPHGVENALITIRAKKETGAFSESILEEFLSDNNTTLSSSLQNMLNSFER